MTAEKRYNGWTNYETWNVALWLGNDQGSYNYWNGVAQECWDEAEAEKSFTRDERAALDLADRLKDELNEGAPDLDGCYADLLNAALSEVNWYEIAEHYIAEADKSAADEDEADDEE